MRAIAWAVTASGWIAVEAGGRIPPKAPGGFAPDCAAAASIYGGAIRNLSCLSASVLVIDRPNRRGTEWSLRLAREEPFQARSSGVLFLGINDDNFANNSGIWTAHCRLVHVETPGSCARKHEGDGVLALSRKRSRRYIMAS